MRKVCLITLLALAVSAAPASAAVLISAPKKHPACGDPNVPGIWAQPGTKAPASLPATRSRSAQKASSSAFSG